MRGRTPLSRHRFWTSWSYLEGTERAIGLTEPPRLFRPPGGVAWPRQLKLAQERGYVCVLGSAYPHDPVHPPVGKPPLGAWRCLGSVGVPRSQRRALHPRSADDDLPHPSLAHPPRDRFDLCVGPDRDAAQRPVDSRVRDRAEVLPPSSGTMDPYGASREAGSPLGPRRVADGDEQMEARGTKAVIGPAVGGPLPRRAPPTGSRAPGTPTSQRCSQRR